ncbi:MAG TPA: signal peptide peptidase SppA [Planctomycetaceae bacterium]|nr:signal peptide peptidase SppA [Planctomycetaceae bacterium]
MVSEDRSENETTTPLESSDSSQEPVVGAGAGERRGPAGSPRVWRVFRWIAVVLLLGSLGGNWGQYRLWQATRGGGPQEVFHSGEDGATAKLAVIPVEGVIMSPLTDQVLSMIDLVQKDESVRGMVLAIDSPGGLVADSHQIYHRLEKYRMETGKPVMVSMSRIATSGGLYVAMGSGPTGRVFAEPTTWTGSIGVIIPRYDVSSLSDRFGVRVDPLKTGPLKDSLNPFRPLSDQDRTVWKAILDDAFDRFIGVIAENRSGLDENRVRELATGQIYTANQALEHGLVDEIGYQEDVIESLKSVLKLSRVRVVTYRTRPGWIDLLLDQVESRDPERQLAKWLETGVPRGMYLSSWGTLPRTSLE